MFCVERVMGMMGRRAIPALRYSFSTSNNKGWKVEENTSLNEPERTSRMFAKNVGMNKFLTRMYNTTGLSIMGALSAGYLASGIPLFLANPFATAIGGGLVTIASLMGVRYMSPTHVREYENGAPILKTQNSAARLGLFGLGTLSLGLSASPLFAMAAMINSSILPTAIGITGAIFFGASFMAYRMPKGKMLGYGRMFMGSLLGLIGLQLAGMGAMLVMGPNPFSLMLFRADTYLGILLFSGLIAYDTHVAIKSYEENNADHLGMSVDMLLNFWNILVRVIQILSFRGNE